VKLKTGNVKNDECSYKNYRHFVKYQDKSTEIGKCVLCGYKLARNRQNVTEIYLAWVKILQKVLGGCFLCLTLYVLHPAVVSFVIFPSFIWFPLPFLSPPLPLFSPFPFLSVSLLISRSLHECCWRSIDPSMLLRLLAATTRTNYTTFNISLLLLTAKDGSPRHAVCLNSVICDNELIAQQDVTRMCYYIIISVIVIPAAWSA